MIDPQNEEAMRYLRNISGTASMIRFTIWALFALVVVYLFVKFVL